MRHIILAEVLLNHGIPVKLTEPAKRGAAPASFPPSEPSAARFRFFLSFAAPLFLLTERFSMILQNAAFGGGGNEITRRMT